VTSAPRRRGIVIRDRYVLGDPNRPVDPAEFEAERTHLAAITGFDIDLIHFDQMYVEDRMVCHLRFLEAVATRQAEFIFYHPHLYIDQMHINVRPEVLFAARALYGPRLIFSFGDTAYGWQTAYLAGYAAIGDISASWDGNGSRVKAMVPDRTVLDLWAPRSAAVFRDLGLERDVDVCFAGSRVYYQDRQDMLAELKQLGVQVFSAGGDPHNYLSMDDYVQLLSRSKISLNFSRTADGNLHQLKGRVIESILCGALLFESENEVTARYLTPYRHYIPFGDAADLAAKIGRYLSNEPARRAVVAAARAHVLENLSERAWWRRVIQELDRTWVEVTNRRKQQGEVDGARQAGPS
jgi:hypothetical protein